MAKIQVNCAFDGGSILVKDISSAPNLRFELRKDSNSHFAQWFYFQVNGIQDQELSYSLEGLAESAYPEGWPDYNVCASYDNQAWFRIPSHYQNHQLHWQWRSPTNSIYFAYFEPYSYQRHLQLIGKFSCKPRVTHAVLGQSLDGKNVDLLQVGDPDSAYKVWLTARQHPGETMAEWLIEGFLERLVESAEAISHKLLESCVFYVVPNMNPDGSYRGNLRANAGGANLNREWLNPSLERSPEVYWVRKHMEQTGVDLFLDIHGDEALPYVFTAGCEDNPSYSAKQQQWSDLFRQTLLAVNPDYQTEYGYVKGQFTTDTPTMATNWVGNRFDCLALTLEMPFKDNANLPDLAYGWNAKRSKIFGTSLLTAIYGLIFTLDR